MEPDCLITVVRFPYTSGTYAALFPGGGWAEASAHGFNDYGRVVGDGTDAFGRYRGSTAVLPQ
jgi:hypothetical protein